MGKRIPAGEYIVLQEVKQKQVSGAFSHSKLVEPLDNLKPSRVTIGDCQDAVATQIITTEDGRQLRTENWTRPRWRAKAER